MSISLPFDNEEKELVLSKEAFIEQVEEYKNYKLNDSKSRIISTQVRYYPCYLHHKSIHRFKENVKIEIETEKLKIDICHDKTFLFGLIALEINAYHDEYQSPFEYEHAIRIEYKNEEQILDDEREEQLIETFKFELLSNNDISIDTYEFDTDWDFLEEEEEEEKIDKNQIILKPLLQYEEGIKMYLVTESIYDSEFKFLSLYKILEHYSPIALRVDVLDSLAKKLDSPKSLNPDSIFLSSIIELASSFELRKRDKELIRTVLLKSVDIIDLIDYFPAFLTKLLKDYNISYSAKKNDLDRIYQKISEVLYATRNLFAHAKANYELTGFECPESELDNLIEFTNQIVIRTIKWYSRLPKYIK